MEGGSGREGLDLDICPWAAELLVTPVDGSLAEGRVTVVSVVRVSSSIVDLLGRFDNTSAVGRSATAN